MSEITLALATIAFLFVFYKCILLPKLKKLKSSIYSFLGIQKDQADKPFDSEGYFRFMQRRNLSPLREIPEKINFQNSSCLFEDHLPRKNQPTFIKDLFTPTPQHKRHSHSLQHYGGEGLNNRYNHNNLIFGDLPKVDDISAFKSNNKFMDTQYGQPLIIDQYNQTRDQGATIDKRLHIRSSSYKEMPQGTFSNNFQPTNNMKFSNQVITTIAAAPVYKTHAPNFPIIQPTNELSSIKSSINSGFSTKLPAYKSKYSVNVSDIKSTRPVNQISQHQGSISSGQKDYNRKTFFNVH